MNIKKRKSINRNYRRRSYRGGIFADEITDSTCAICIEELEDNDTCTTQCGHKYHLHCILSTYDLNGGKNIICPMCRLDIIPPKEEPEAVPQSTFSSEMAERRRINEETRAFITRSRRHLRRHARSLENDRLRANMTRMT